MSSKLLQLFQLTRSDPRAVVGVPLDRRRAIAHGNVKRIQQDVTTFRVPECLARVLNLAAEVQAFICVRVESSRHGNARSCAQKWPYSYLPCRWRDRKQSEVVKRSADVQESLCCALSANLCAATMCDRLPRGDTGSSLPPA